MWVGREVGGSPGWAQGWGVRGHEQVGLAATSSSCLNHTSGRRPPQVTW